MPEGIVLAAVLGAALLHATWNALLKSSGDRVISMAMQDSVMFLCGAVILGTGLVAVPAPAVWPFVVASAAVHIFYRAFLLKTYRYGDLSKSYPIARGTAPLYVACAGNLIGDDLLGFWGFASVILISLGIISLVFSRSNGQLIRLDRGISYALLTGLLIAAYSTIDSRGVRLADTALGYIASLWLSECFLVPAYALTTRRALFIDAVRWHGGRGAMGGVLSGTAYALIIWAFSHASAAQVVALRETSVIFGAAIGAYILKEGFGPRRILSAATVALGVIALRWTG